MLNSFQDFILVGSENCQIRFFNPETLLCRRILAIPGVPLVRLSCSVDPTTNSKTMNPEFLQFFQPIRVFSDKKMNMNKQIRLMKIDQIGQKKSFKF